MGGGGLTLSLMRPCGGGRRPWNEEEVRSCNNEYIFFLRVFAQPDVLQMHAFQSVQY